ncbi:SdpI family protein [Tuwongella immobilis]|uniref:DUF1648 domain-containing protein n=1 Tax=Tuwongella immobilis TaxID=692036 RepID=A0A6C2YV87_9BACT|nr:SdpI family protein [Tuwongella immobilis]VIP04899.1 Uncharacterized protein OS=Isosphaera pallida (strain ATCC 43644 / DSM 9630 / IS1B) GN=Isop_0009 PE=4 SV=1: DUF1648: SdpI [Tuwongella immobilis]VTS07157.1 Uncharacterized protein OS=Isosphaera pallida (strain ATCC 43644 / DSM 9630 / IS1B) GN=Isop_0009 PE=4 SV=1: DUF1648: SdpI [Tuwongella immobilis]
MNRYAWIGWGLLTVVLAVTLTAYWGYADRLPEQIPVHWNAAGEADRFTTSEYVLQHWLLMPAIIAAVSVAAVGLPKISPQEYRIERFSDTWYQIMLITQVMMAFFQISILLSSFDPNVPAGRGILVGIGVGFMLLGNILGRVRRNFWMGIRTPWTLSSEVVWNRTHRVGGFLFVLMGLVGLLTGLFNWSIWPFLGITLLGSLGVCLYSLILYKRLERRGEMPSVGS